MEKLIEKAMELGDGPISESAPMKELERQIEDHGSHTCVDEHIYMLKQKLEEIENLWTKQNLDCQDVKNAFSLECIPIADLLVKLDWIIENLKGQ